MYSPSGREGSGLMHIPITCILALPAKKEGNHDSMGKFSAQLMDRSRTWLYILLIYYIRVFPTSCSCSIFVYKA